MSMFSGELFPEIGTTLAKPRDRSREGAGKSDNSWQKHDIINRVGMAQAYGLDRGIIFRRGRGVIVDMHAGDGNGVEQRQMSLLGPNLSRTTSELAVSLGRKLNADVVLCESNPIRRAHLQERWPEIPVLKNHKEAAGLLSSSYRWALVMNDPNGCGKHGVEHMQAIASKVSICDFVIAVNEGSIKRNLGIQRPEHQKFAWMIDYPEWGRRLGRKQVAVSRLIQQSNGFRHRILVVANWFADGVSRNPFFQVFPCN